MNDRKIIVNITTGTFLKFILLVLAIVFIYMVRDLALVVVFSIVLASGIEPIAGWFQNRKIPRTLAVILIYLSVFILLGIIFYFVIPTIFTEFSSFASNINTYLEKPVRINILSDILSGLPVSISNILQETAMRAADYIDGLTAGFFRGAAAIFGGALSFVLIIVLSFYLSVQKNGIENFLRVVVPVRYEEYIVGLWLRSRRKIGQWLQGQLLLCVLVGVLTFLGLTILGVEYSFIFALMTGVFEIIPIFGPILAAIPPIIIAFAESPVLALKVGILYIIIQQFENHLIYPLVVRQIVGIPPIMTILAIVIGAELAGFMGIVLAVPIVTVFFEILKDIEAKKRSANESVSV